MRTILKLISLTLEFTVIHKNLLIPKTLKQLQGLYKSVPFHDRKKQLRMMECA